MNEYVYSGPVVEFDICIANVWKGRTKAKSANRARSNLAYQFKKANNRLPNAKITLPGELIEIPGKET